MSFIKTFLIILGAAAVLGIFYFMTLLTPGKKADYDYVYVDPELESGEILKQSEKLEEEFEKAVLGGKITEVDTEKLRKAIALQEVYVDKARSLDRSPTARLTKLQTRLHNIEAEPLSKIIEETEQKGDKLASEEKDDEAIKAYKQAYDLQSRINTDYRFSKYKDIRKGAYLDSQIKKLQARPLYLKSVEAETAARNAIEKKDWQTAQNQFERAIEILMQMNSEYPTSVYTDFTRLQKLDIDLDSLKSADLNSKIQEHLKKAKAAETKNDYLLASEAYGDAAEQQKVLNKLFPKSENASEEKVIEYEKKKSDAYSWKFANEIITQQEALNIALYEGKIEKAKEISNNLLRKTEQFAIDFPRSNLIDGDLVLRLRYINFMMHDIAKIQKMVLQNLQKLQGLADVEMLKTEVSQELFSLVMQENPSRYVNPKKPVDSITYEEALRFCNRLTWLLGRKVSIPTKAQFKAAVGSLKYTDLNEISWNNLNSGGQTHEIGTRKLNDRGFHDILGNVSEYIQPSAEESASGVRVIGGNAQSQTDSIMDLAEFSMDEKQRNRMVGFRVVISTAINKK